MISQWTDHITSTDNVTVVAASGNSDDLGGDYAVASPAKGYNVIAVGNFNDNNTISIADDTLYETSCYLEKNNTAAEKPDVLAPGTNITIDNYEASGTSFAAPHVTGILAQLMQQSLALRSRPSLAKSLITVGARYKIDSDSYSACGIHTFSDKEGAGKVDARNASTVLGSMRYYYGGTTVFNSGGSIVQNVNVTSADVLFRVSLTWERTVTVNSHTNGSVTSSTLSDLDLKVTAPDGTVFKSESGNNNVELIEIIPAEHGYGTYKIEVKRYSGSGTEWMAVSWW